MNGTAQAPSPANGPLSVLSSDAWLGTKRYLADAGPSSESNDQLQLDSTAASIIKALKPLAAGTLFGQVNFHGRTLNVAVADPTARLAAWVGSPAPRGRHTNSVVEMARGTAVTTNGSFSSPADATLSLPLGPVLGNGAVLVNEATVKAGWGPVPRSYLGQDNSGRYFMGETRPGETGRGLIDRLKASGLKPQTVLGGLGSLIIKRAPADGHARKVQGLIDGQANNAPNARTVAGLTRDGRLLLFTQEGDSTAGQGAGVRDLANLLLALRNVDPLLDVTDAVILDGGGTAEMVVPGRNLDSRAGLHHRTIPTGLRVLPGAVADRPPASNHPPANWFDSLFGKQETTGIRQSGSRRASG